MVESEYAKAIFEIAKENNKIDDYRGYFRTLSYSLDDKDFFNLLKSPFIDKNKKKEILKNVYGKEFDEDFMNFLFVVVDHDRFSEIEGMRSEYKKLLYVESGMVKIHITSAHELDEKELEGIKKVLSTKFGDKKLKIKNEIDPNLLGGIQILANGESIDMSAKNTLNKIKESL